MTKLDPGSTLYGRLQMKFSTTARRKDVRVTQRLFEELCAEDAPEEFNPLGNTYNASSIEQLLQEIYHLVIYSYGFDLNPIAHLRKYFTNTSIGTFDSCRRQDGKWWKDLRDDTTHILCPTSNVGPVVWITVKNFAGSNRIAILNNADETLRQLNDKFATEQESALKERGFEIVYARHLRM